MSDSAISFYRRLGHLWVADRRKQTWLFEQGWLERFRTLLPQEAHVLDLGCGPGSPLAAWFIGQGCRVTGIDSAPAMLDLCRAQFPDQEWIDADMRCLNLARRFDGVLAWNSFFHLSRDDQRAMFPVFGAHAAAGAPLMFTAGPDDGEAIGSLYGADLHHASLAPQAYRRLLAEHGFREIAHVPQDLTCGGHTVWLAQKL
ncbi:MAG: class I SAM-dependent methyltransferase [Acetobacteraceae bacterium]|nr:class I SAM-dependent methyltransferase [Acetobacteraceae bacterium]